MPLLRGGTRAAPEILISGFTERFRMVRIRDWKIVRVNAESWELFDLRADPTELLNLATKNAEKLASMVTAYHHWIEKEQAVLPRFEEVSDP